MGVAWGLCVAGLCFGAYLGARGLIDPNWAAKLVRLRENQQAGSFAEFRATYGGMFFALHVAALLLVLYYLRGGAEVPGVAAAGAVFVVAAAWAGAAFGRLVSVWRDKGANTHFNRLSAVVEAGVALCIGSPWVLWLAGG